MTLVETVLVYFGIIVLVLALVGLALVAAVRRDIARGWNEPGG